MASPIRFRGFRNIDLEVLEESFNNVGWDEIYRMASADEQLQFLNSNVLHLLQASVPFRSRNVNGKMKCWFSPEIKRRLSV